jgi:hypothetical protein
MDKDLTRVLDRDDMVATAISTFTSMTAHCARCHDHKFDPIPQQEYYNLQSVFAGVDRADRPFDDDPATHRRSQELLRRKHASSCDCSHCSTRWSSRRTPRSLRSTVRSRMHRCSSFTWANPRRSRDLKRRRRLEARRVADRKRRQEFVDAIVGRETYEAIERIKAEFAPIDAELNSLPKPSLVYAVTDYFTSRRTFRPALQPRPVFVLARGSVSASGDPAVPGALSCVPSLQPPVRCALGSENAVPRWPAGSAIPQRPDVALHREPGMAVSLRLSGIVETANDFGAWAESRRTRICSTGWPCGSVTTRRDR